MDDRAASTLATSTAQRRNFSRRLLAWFRRAARDLPWRQTKDLYAIWVSEIMLQQTQVATVVPYYHRFLAQFPDVHSLAQADEQQVLRLWEGLGYYRRARQLHAAAQCMAREHGGRFPTTYAAVRSLPGIGRYTAGAILSIGLDARLPILEANTVRVLSRLAGYRGDPASSAGQKHLWSLAETLLPARDCGAFNQALMELGSEVCSLRAPACDACPVAMHCRARAEQLVEKIPKPPTRTKYELVREIAVVVRRGRKVLVRQCQPGERWAGLWDFPRFAGSRDEIAPQVAALTAVDVEPGERLVTLKHGVTRFRITLECYAATCNTNPKRQRGNSKSSAAVRWVLPSQLAALPLSTTGRKLAQLV
ncbi:MAG: A/G-specific adenine glycosylase [Planctomycetaceae bacterium]|nr:A/G-specific adenine glycosylase [Planctomycetaceae bacterium]